MLSISEPRQRPYFCNAIWIQSQTALERMVNWDATELRSGEVVSPELRQRPYF
jgi:hypothetical protein